MNRWRNYNPNPTGRGRAVGDCAVRAVAKALGLEWETAYALIANNGFQMGDMPSSNSVWGAVLDMPSSNSVWGSVLRQHGFTRSAIPNTCPDCYTLERFAEEHPTGTFVVGTGNHVATIQDGQIWDAWDSSNEIPIYFWQEETR